MNATVPTQSVSLLLIQAQRTLGVTQKGLAELLGCSSRTVMRYQHGGGYLLPSHYETLARACHPHDASFAAELARHAGKTLIELELERPPAPPTTSAPTHGHLLDSIVCVAAEAMQTTPQAMRPGLKAAFERVVALGLSAEQVLGAMAPTSTVKGKGKGA
jgi:transcriptional regulator with XRE-family HTH domain